MFFFIRVDNQYFQIISNDKNLIKVFMKRWVRVSEDGSDRTKTIKIDVDALLKRNKKALRYMRSHLNKSEFDFCDFLTTASIEQKMIEKNTLFLHGSAITHKDCAFVFLGPSGMGKSTIRARLEASSIHIMSDDTTIVKREKDRFYVMSSVFDKAYVSTYSNKVRLYGLFFLTQSDKDLIVPMSSMEQYARNVLCNNTLMYSGLTIRKEILRKVARRILSLAAHVPGYLFFFKKTGAFSMKLLENL